MTGQGNNLDETLKSYGLTRPAALIKNWDANFALGGPIVKDRLWFYNNVRSYGTHQEVPGLFANKNAGDRRSGPTPKTRASPAAATRRR